MKVTVHTRRACRAAWIFTVVLACVEEAIYFAWRMMLNVGSVVRVDWRRGILTVAGPLALPWPLKRSVA